jgi:hypothetical protein
LTDAPPLNNDEVILYNHLPSLRVFKRVALFLLAVSLLPTLAFAVTFPDTYWPIAPLFVTCFLLVQERFTLGRHRAWITNQRIILQGGADIPLGSIDTIKSKTVAVQVRHSSGGKPLQLFYPEDGPAVTRTIDAARKAVT